jgi:phage baseplate assembly protein W
MTTTNLYTDISTNFTIHPIRGDLVLLKDADSVKRSIRNLIFTDPFERPFNPLLGGGINASLFENISRDTESIIKIRITETIENFEPRANLINVKVKALPDDNAYNVTIVFSINNNVQPIQLDFILRRVR